MNSTFMLFQTQHGVKIANLGANLMNYIDGILQKLCWNRIYKLVKDMSLEFLKKTFYLHF